MNNKLLFHYATSRFLFNTDNVSDMLFVSFIGKDDGSYLIASINEDSPKSYKLTDDTQPIKKIAKDISTGDITKLLAQLNVRLDLGECKTLIDTLIEPIFSKKKK